MGIESKTASFVITFGEEKDPLTAGQVVDALIRLECIYNLLAYMAAGDDYSIQVGNQKALAKQGLLADAYVRELGSADPLRSVSQMYATGRQLRTPLRDYRAELAIHALGIGSVKVKGTGVASAIDALVSLLDPTARAARREALRHEKVKNRISEDQARVKLVVERVKAVQTVAKAEKTLVDRYIYQGCTKEQAVTAAKHFLSRVADVTASLDDDEIGISLLPAPTDEQNEDAEDF